MSLSRPKPYRAVIALFLAFLQAASAVAGTIEFTKEGLNARSSLSFRGTRNILTTVPRGTKGEVLERWTLPSGNTGVKVKIKHLGSTETSLKLDEEIWVYYHREPTLRRVELLDDDGKKVANADEGKWAIALSTFRTEKSEPEKEVACTDCETKPERTEQFEPLSPIQVETLAGVVETTQITSDVATEELMTYMSADQRANLKRRQIAEIGDETNREIAEALIAETRRQDIPLSLVLAMIQVESHFYPKGHNRSSGARGLLQVMPANYAADSGKRDYVRLYDPTTNLRLGIKLLAGYLKKYDGNVTNALRAFNFGPGNYDSYLAGTCKAKFRGDGKCFLPDETLEYVPAVMKNQAAYVAYEKTSRTSLSVAKN